MNRLLRLVLPAMILGLLSVGAQAKDHGAILGVAVDHARIIEIDRPAATVIVGNPAIVDVEVLSSERLVLTGRSYGITNLVILDQAGEMILDEQVAVQTFENNTVRVYRQASRITYACAPKCEPTVTIGDDPGSFQQANEQYVIRQAMANEAAAR
ncbi:pilus assembly protein N-terminal domain-containing protein [Aurantimonas sp. C2-6-R+9]|uniref:pilus assembly protein N-terminal domain-containing protein n=1 Tax=unclassified Aurantimonas TaxID=2638230 RepID=UPI002E16E53D|nr:MULTISPECIES: pilus assembly protein N-terminal domain-containing protein [unclassified Aurantimonas]MEC5292402.1 pilus assembly protein N-terminal domain-containing protein [Aurantimonas sp. C2-3-R2]MEC5382555.1 pilus assembly protein N-terminal domain-containing protein [Aurantimonas sp. C2-6-R+9]MEC5413461.1 pilus assembly protein N-terminal domain-containing protein [Aurantimonas sp. C2-4-R8]